MLVAGIDRNKASESDKFVERVVSSPNSIPIAKSEESLDFRKQFPKRKGIILRNGDKRHGDRRNQPSEPVSAKSFKERRRQSNNRAPHPSWNPQTHEIIVIAVEKDNVSAKKWNVGEEVYLGPGSAKTQITNFQNQGSRISTSVQTEEKDYIVSLSRSVRKNI